MKLIFSILNGSDKFSKSKIRPFALGLMYAIGLSVVLLQLRSLM